MYYVGFLVAQQVKDLVVSPLWLWLQLWYGFAPWPGNFHVPQKRLKRKYVTLIAVLDIEPALHSWDKSFLAIMSNSFSNLAFFSFFFLLFRAAPAAYGSSQARSPIRATAASLRHSHSNARSELCLLPTPQLTAMLDP